jgi:hypothetical protein
MEGQYWDGETDLGKSWYLGLAQNHVEQQCYSAIAVSVAMAILSKLERVQTKLSAFRHNRFFQDVQYHYNLVVKLNLQTLHIRRRHSDALFLVNVALLYSKHSAVVYLLRTYCNGFYQRVARQQLCKHGPTGNDRGSCFFPCPQWRHAANGGGHVIYVSCGACPFLVLFRDDESILGRR